MTLTRLDARLRAVADAVRPGARIADVGCDHGYLICTLALEGRIPSGIACDIREGPLSGARSLISSCGLNARIDTRLCDGLSAVRADEADDIVIAGMGGETIAAILAAADWVKDEQKHLILQPQSRPEILRHWLAENGFELLSERGVRAGRFLYVVMTAHYCGTVRQIGEVQALTGLLAQDPHPDSRELLRTLAERLRYAGEQSGDAERCRQAQEIFSLIKEGGRA